MRKFTAILLALVLVLSLAVPVAAEEPAKSKDIVILYTNDVHTYINNEGGMGYDSVAALKAELQEQYETVILVDAGDHAQGTAYGSMDKGETIIKLMNAAGYDVATLGNHEFDYGMDGNINIRTWANFPYLSCNFYNEAAGVRGDNVLDSYKIFDFSGKKVAIVGVTTPESFTKSTPAYFQNEAGEYIYGIAGGKDGAALYADVQKAVDAAKADGADYVVALGHLGQDASSSPWTSEEVIANVSGLTAFIDGHSHTNAIAQSVTDKDGKTVVLTQTGEYLGGIGKMIINAETGAVTTERITGYTGSDAAVKAIQDDWIDEIETKLGVKIGSTKLTFDNYDAEDNRLVRKQETNTGDFCADALYYLFDNMGMDVDVAIMNGGGVRNTAVTGDISYKTCKTIHTFGNVACLQTVTGQQLLDALEWGARDVGGAKDCGGFLQVSGITYDIDVKVTSTVQKDDKGVWTGGPTGMYRVFNVRVYNKETNKYEPLDLNAKYNLAGYNYTLRDLGDGFAMFAGAENVLDYVMEDYMVLANYVKGFEGGVVGAANSPLKAKYSNMWLNYSDVEGSGRIEMLTETVDATAIIYTNDVHTYIDGAMGYDTVAALKELASRIYANVLLVDAGDHAQGTAYGSMDKGETIIKLMNAAGYDAATMGNHEFDYGMDGNINLRTWAEFPYLSCNFYNESNGVRGTNVLDSYKIFDFGSEKIAIVGITTPESFTKSTPAYFQNEAGEYIYGIAGGTDGAALYADVQKAVDDARAAGATKVIALGHLGNDASSKPWTSAEVIANTTGIDAFIDGHSHSTVEETLVANKNGENVVLTQTGEYMKQIGIMVIADGDIFTSLGDTTVSDPKVKAMQDAWINSVDEMLGVKIGSTELTFNNYDAEGNRLVRKQETNTGDFAADALYYLFDNMGMDVDVAIMNGGGVRNKAVTGDISFKTCKTIHTFGNVACLQTVTGQQLLDALEWGARDVGTAECGGFLQVSGITYKINTAKASSVQKDDKGVWAGGPTDGYRVYDVMVYNKETNKYEPLDLDAKYNLAGYNYTLRDLGDGFAMFAGAENVLDYVMEDYMVLANYVKGFDNGVVGAANSPLKAKYTALKLDYSTVNGSGRIENVPVDPSNPGTGDAGVLSYVVLSISSLMGMAWMGKKRK